jgi:hypothetical protein
MRVLARGEVLRLSSGELRGAEMGKWSMLMDAGLLVSAGVLVAGAAHAQADAIAPDSATMAQSVGFTYHRNSARRLETDWDDGGIALRGARIREGRKANCETYHCGQWHRAFSGQVQGWVGVTRNLDLQLQFELAHESWGNPESPLLTGRTSGMSSSLAARLGSGRSAFTVTAFDRTGWSSAELADFAQRVNNGETRARRGMALEAATTGVVRGNEVNTGFVLARASTPGGRGESTALLRLAATF